MADPTVLPIIKSSYSERLTLDVDTPSPKSSKELCDSLKNVIRRWGGSIAKRPGAKMVASNELNDTGLSWDVYCGLHHYSYSNDVFGTTEKLLIITGGANPRVYELRSENITVTMSGFHTGRLDLLGQQIAGAGPGGQAARSWGAGISIDSVIPSGWPKNFSDGVNKDTYSTLISVADLITAIDGEANVACTGTSPAQDQASVGQFGSKSNELLSGAVNFPYSTIYTPISAPTTAVQNVGLDTIDYANLKGVNVDNCMYFPMGKRLPLLKYDGQLAYKPGLPRALLSAITDAGSGATHAAGNQYIYRIGFWRVDNHANQIYGPYSDDTLPVALHTVGGSPTDVNLAFFPLNRAALGSDSYDSLPYDPRAAKVNGAQAAVTAITVDSGNQLQVGDVFYCLNGATSENETRTVLTRTDTQVTFTPALTVSDDDILSNIRVQIQRTENGGIDFFEVANIANNSLLGANVAQTYLDATVDTSLGESIEDQIKLPEPPPNATLCCTHQGLVVYANLADDPIGFTWNDPQWGHEAYPSATNRDQIIDSKGGGITAIFSESDTALAIFKNRSYFRIEGDLAAGQYTINEINSNSLGIASQASVVKTEDGVFAISDRGPVLIQNGTISLEVAAGVRNYFYDNDYTQVAGSAISPFHTPVYMTQRATGVFWTEKNCVLFHIPAETGTPAAVGNTPSMKRYASDFSFWLCYDLDKKEWREWNTHGLIGNGALQNGINAHVAMIESGRDIYFISSNQFNGASKTNWSTNYVWKFQPGTSILDYVDNTDAIEFAPRTTFESLGQPSSDKKMTEIKIYDKKTAARVGSSYGITVREYRNDSLAAPYTQATRTFDSALSAEKIIDPVPGDFLSNSVELNNSERYEVPTISGFELSYKIMATPEVKDAKGT